MKWEFREVQERYDSSIDGGDEGLKSMKSFKWQLQSLSRVLEFLYTILRVHRSYKSTLIPVLSEIAKFSVATKESCLVGECALFLEHTLQRMRKRQFLVVAECESRFHHPGLMLCFFLEYNCFECTFIYKKP